MIGILPPSPSPQFPGSAVSPVSPVAERLGRMGLGHLNRTPVAGTPTSLDLFPWWAQIVFDPERDEDLLMDVSRILAEIGTGVASEGGREARSLSILESTLPFEPVPSLARRLAGRAVQEGRHRRISDDTVVGILWSLGFMASGPHQADVRPVLVDLAHQLLVDRRKGDASTIVRILGKVAAQRGLEELAPPLAAAAVSDNPCVALELPGFLARLGEPGWGALRRLGTTAVGQRSEALRASLAACLEGDFDGLVPFLESPEGWQVRGATARLLGELVRAGRPPGAALEMLLSRARLEDDSDTRAVMADGIGIAVLKLGAEGVAAVLGILRDQFDDGHGDFLLDALLLAGPEAIDPVELEHLRVAPQGGDGMADKSRKRALNRLLSWQRGYPVCVADWASPTVFRLLQWEDLPLPPAVSGWFSTDPDIPLDQILARILSGEGCDLLGYALAQILRRQGGASLPAIELAAVQSLVQGNSSQWSTFCGVLAGCAVPIGLHPAELRAALGEGVGVPLVPDAAAAGRLLAVASHPVDQAQVALTLLSEMGPDFRELARHALATTPPPKDRPSGLGSILGSGRLGPSKLNATAVGGIPIQLCEPAGLPLECQLLFERTPPQWTAGVGCLHGLESISRQQLDFSSRLTDWNNLEGVRSITAEAPVLQTQVAILAAVACGDEDLNRIGMRVACVAPDTVLGGHLGPLVAIHRQRGAERQVVSQGDSEPGAPTPPAPPEQKEDDLLQELEMLLRD